MKVLRIIFLSWGILQLFYAVLNLCNLLGFDLNGLPGGEWLFLLDPHALGGSGGIKVNIILGISACMIAVLLKYTTRMHNALTIFYLTVILVYLLPYFVVMLLMLPYSMYILFSSGSSSGWNSLTILGLEIEAFYTLEIIFVSYILIKEIILFKSTQAQPLHMRMVSKGQLICVCFILLITIKFLIAFLPHYSHTYNLFTTKIITSKDATPVVSGDIISPDHKHTIEYRPSNTSVDFILKNIDGTAIANISYPYPKQSESNHIQQGCACDVSFKGWKDNKSFVVETLKDGVWYEDVADITNAEQHSRQSKLLELWGAF